MRKTININMVERCIRLSSSRYVQSARWRGVEYGIEADRSPRCCSPRRLQDGMHHTRTFFWVQTFHLRFFYTYRPNGKCAIQLRCRPVTRSGWLWNYVYLGSYTWWKRDHNGYMHILSGLSNMTCMDTVRCKVGWEIKEPDVDVQLRISQCIQDDNEIQTTVHTFSGSNNKNMTSANTVRRQVKEIMSISICIHDSKEMLTAIIYLCFCGHVRWLD